MCTKVFSCAEKPLSFSYPSGPVHKIMISHLITNTFFKTKVAAVIVLLLFALPSLAQASSAESDADKMKQALKLLDIRRAGGEDVMLPESPGSIALDEETRAAYLQSLRQYYGYRATGLEHRRAVFQWQLFSAKVIFVAVLTLVGLGMLFRCGAI